MKSNKVSDLEVMAVLNDLKKGLIQLNMYAVVRNNQDVFGDMGITSGMIKKMLELKQKIIFCPDPTSYSLLDQNRVNYLYENMDNPYLGLTDENELGFMNAIKQYDQLLNNYREDVDKMSGLAKAGLYKCKEERYEMQFGGCEAELLTDLFLGKRIQQGNTKPYSLINSLFRRYDLYTAYNMDDNRVAIRWKAGLALESKGLLSKGTTEKILNDEGIVIDKIQDSIERHNIDELRVWEVAIHTPDDQPGKYISCRVDDTLMEMVRLSPEDEARREPLLDGDGLAIKYFKSTLDENREKNRAIADERTLARINLPYIERLVDIYRNGMNEQDMMLAKRPNNQCVDTFWIDTMMQGIEKEPIDRQKDAAFDRIADHLDGLRPEMLSVDEFLCATRIPLSILKYERGEERMLMELPKPLLSLIEENYQRAQIDRNMIDYVKVLRDFGRVTPQMAYNSMEYFLSNRLYTQWDPMGADDEYGQVTGCNWYPNENMTNPAEKFSPNLISEKQWAELGKMGMGEGASFIPRGAFKQDRVSEVQVYPLVRGGMAIRCKVDGQQQSNRLLTAGDASEYNSRTDLKTLAVHYFGNAFAKNDVLEHSLSR